MAAKNYLSDFQIFTAGRHGIASQHPRMKEVGLSEHLMPHNLFFQHTAAFYFTTATAATNDAVVESLWNGTDDTTGALGTAKFVFNPGFNEPTGVSLKGVMPLITLLNPAVQVRVGTILFTQVSDYSVDCTITVVNDAGTGMPSVSGWALFIGKRAHWQWGVSTPASGKVYESVPGTGQNLQTEPLVGGVQVD
tara:strand:+ start:2958 stop:3536 length:579 start_codon:yes stop_codon:yes gene_type:complete